MCSPYVLFNVCECIYHMARYLQVYAASKADLAGVKELLAGTEGMNATVDAFTVAMDEGRACIATCQGQVRQCSRDAGKARRPCSNS